MIVTHYAQLDLDWFHSRCGIPTGSRFGDVMAFKPDRWAVLRPSGTTVRTFEDEDTAWQQAALDGSGFTVEHSPGHPLQARSNYALELACQRLTGKFDDTPGIGYWGDRGNELEPEAREYYEFLSGAVVEQTGLVLLDDESAGISLDGLVGDKGQIEIKCFEMVKHMSMMLANVPLPALLPQIQGGLFITGRPWCDLMLYHPNAPIRGYIMRVERDEPYIAELALQLSEFEKEVRAMVARLESLKGR